jgi:thioredoxin 1
MSSAALPRILCFALVLAAGLACGCNRVQSLVKNLKKSGGTTPAVAGAYSSEQVSTVDASTYEAFVAQQNKLVIVDFYADWCGPCRKLGPILEQAARAHPGVVFVGRVNVDQATKLAADHQVRSIPDVRIFKDGQEVDRFVGCPAEATVLAKIAALAQGITPVATVPAASVPAVPAQAAEKAVQPMPKDWLPPGMQKR